MHLGGSFTLFLGHESAKTKRTDFRNYDHLCIEAEGDREHRRRRRQKGAICLTSILNDDGMAACRFLGISMTQKMLGSRSEVLRDSTMPKKI